MGRKKNMEQPNDSITESTVNEIPPIAANPAPLPVRPENAEAVIASERARREQTKADLEALQTAPEGTSVVVPADTFANTQFTAGEIETTMRKADPAWAEREAASMEERRLQLEAMGLE
jgi:hypothetical protein